MLFCCLVSLTINKFDLNSIKKTMKRAELYLNKCRKSEVKVLLQIAIKAALKTGNILRDLFHHPHQIKFKSQIDLVTEADIASENLIISELEAEQPGVRIITEESHSDYTEIPQGPVWIIDPLDGTTNFAHGFPWFSVSICFMDRGLSQVGVVYSPLQDELFFACRGYGACLNGEKIQVSQENKLSLALLGTGFPYDVYKHPKPVVKVLEKFLTHSQGIRRAGSAALDLAAVACGRLDGFWEVKLKPWDTAAGILLVEEAGGQVSDFQGQEYSPFIPEIVGSNKRIHDQ